MSKHDGEDFSQLPEPTREQLVKAIEAAHEITWELAVHAALRGDAWPALEKLLEGNVPPPRILAALQKALARAKKPGKDRGRPRRYRGLLSERASPLMRARRRYDRLKAQGYDTEEALKLAVREGVRGRSALAVSLGGPSARVTVSQLREAIRKGRASPRKT